MLALSVHFVSNLKILELMSEREGEELKKFADKVLRRQKFMRKNETTTQRRHKKYQPGQFDTTLSSQILCSSFLYLLFAAAEMALSQKADQSTKINLND